MRKAMNVILDERLWNDERTGLYAISPMSSALGALNGNFEPHSLPLMSLARLLWASVGIFGYQFPNCWAKSTSAMWDCRLCKSCYRLLFPPGNAIFSNLQHHPAGRSCFAGESPIHCTKKSQTSGEPFQSDTFISDNCN